MSFWNSTSRLLALVATVGIVTPRPLLLAAPQEVTAVSSRTEVQFPDVALNAQGVFVGTVIDAQGHPAAGVPVKLQQATAPIAETVTDDQGMFAIASLRGGLYDVQIGGQAQAVRIWTANAAPPQSTSGYTVVVGDVARGQGCTGSCTGPCATCGGMGGIGNGPLGFLMNPLVIGAAVAAAIAIPLAIDDDDDDSAS